MGDIIENPIMHRDKLYEGIYSNVNQLLSASLLQKSGKKEYLLTQSMTKETETAVTSSTRWKAAPRSAMSNDTETVSVYVTARRKPGEQTGSTTPSWRLNIYCVAYVTHQLFALTFRSLLSHSAFTQAACRKTNHIWQHLELRLFFYCDWL